LKLDKLKVELYIAAFLYFLLTFQGFISKEMFWEFAILYAW